MKTGKFILRAVLFLLAAIIGGAVLYLYPAWKAAGAVEEKMSLPFKVFELEAELDREEMPAEQIKMFETLAGLTGIEEAALYRLSVKGEMQEERVHLTIWPYGRTEPLFELYTSNDISVINETMVYEAVRSHLAERFGLLGYLMPVQEETVYMTLEQIEQLFGVDLSGFTKERPRAVWDSAAAKEYFLLLAIMSREKQGEGYRFMLDTEQVRLCFETAYKGADGSVRMELQIRELSEILEKADNLPSWLEERLPEVELQGLKSLKNLSLILMPEESGTIEMPGKLADQKTVDTIAGIRQWIQETFGR